MANEETRRGRGRKEANKDVLEVSAGQYLKITRQHPQFGDIAEGRFVIVTEVQDGVTHFIVCSKLPNPSGASPLGHEFSIPSNQVTKKYFEVRTDMGTGFSMIEALRKIWQANVMSLVGATNAQN